MAEENGVQSSMEASLRVADLESYLHDVVPNLLGGSDADISTFLSKEESQNCLAK